MTVQVIAHSTSAGHARLLRNVALLAGSQAVTWSLTLVWTLVVPRAIGADGMGELTTALSVTGIASTCVGLGMTTLLIREIARDPGRAPRMVGTAAIVQMLLFLPAVGATALYLQLGHFGGRQSLVLWLATAGLVPGLVSGPITAAFQAMERMDYIAIGEIIKKACITALSVVLVLLGLGVVSITAVYVATALASLLLSLWWLRSHFRIDWRLNAADVRHVVLGSMPFFASQAFYIAYVWLDAVMLAFLTTERVVGWYGVAARLFGTLLFVASILATASLPRFTAAHRQGLEQLREQARPVLELVLVLSLPVAAGVTLVSGPLVSTLYGPAFAGAAAPLAILALSAPFTYLSMILWQALVATDRQVVGTYLIGGATLVNAVLNRVLIPLTERGFHNGSIGASLALLATEVTVAGGSFFLVRGILDGHSLRRLVRAGVATALMSALVWAVRPYGLVPQVAAGLASFLGLALALRVISLGEIRGLQALARHRETTL